jgi:hypothetical protein
MIRSLQRLAISILACIAITSSAFAQENSNRDSQTSKDTCPYRVVMHKNSAPTGIHGWEGAYILFSDDSNNTLSTCTLSDDLDEDEAIIDLPHEHVNCIWMSGASDYWINFEVYDYNENMLFQVWAGSLENGTIFLEFTPDCSNEQPAPCENFEAVGSLVSMQSYLTWTNPSVTVNGEPTSLSSVVILRDDEPIHTINNPSAGEAMSWTDDTPRAGVFNYSIYAVNEAGQSSLISDIDTVGTYNIIPLTGSDFVTSYCGFVGCELSNIGLYPAGYDGKLTIRPAEEGSCIHLEGIHFIYDGWLGNDPDHLYVYDGEDTNGQLLADCTNSCFDKSSDGKGVLDVTSLSGPVTLYFVTGQSGGCRGFSIYSSCVPSTSVQESKGESFDIYPNPACDVLFIEGENISHVEIYNAFGQRILVDEKINKIDVSGFVPGIYMVRVDGMTKKVIIK